MTRPWWAELWQHWSHCQVLFSQFRSAPMWDAVEALVREHFNVHQYARLARDCCWSREKGRKKCVIAGKKRAHCVNDKPLRGRRTLHCHADIHSLVGSLLPKIWRTLWCFHREQLTHTHWWASKLLSSHFNLTLSARNLKHSPFVLFSQSFQASRAKPGISNLPLCPEGLEELQCAGCDP